MVPRTLTLCGADRADRDHLRVRKDESRRGQVLNAVLRHRARVGARAGGNNYAAPKDPRDADHRGACLRAVRRCNFLENFRRVGAARQRPVRLDRDVVCCAEREIRFGPRAAHPHTNLIHL